jgi:hypothetical protein
MALRQAVRKRLVNFKFANPSRRYKEGVFSISAALFPSVLHFLAPAIDPQVTR